MSLASAPPCAPSPSPKPPFPGSAGCLASVGYRTAACEFVGLDVDKQVPTPPPNTVIRILFLGRHLKSGRISKFSKDHLILGVVLRVGIGLPNCDNTGGRLGGLNCPPDGPGCFARSGFDGEGISKKFVCDRCSPLICRTNSLVILVLVSMCGGPLV